MKKVGVLGGGSWGTALAKLSADLGYETKIWAFEKECADSINLQHENKTFLKNIILPTNLTATNDIENVLAWCDILIITIPTQFIRNSLKAIDLNKFENIEAIISASKGIEISTLKICSEIYAELFPDLERKIFYISGPSFALEVAKKMPTTIVLAGKDSKMAKELQKDFSSDYFRIYTNEDIVGVEIGGAVKNVVAIATGLSDGLGYGNNTRAAIITRGLAEITRLVLQKGGSLETMSGLAGLGDLVLTCTSTLSRNYSFGYRLGQGEISSDIMNSSQMVCEGVFTAKALYSLAKEENIEMPIAQKIYEIIYEGVEPKVAVFDLMQRELKNEVWR